VRIVLDTNIVVSGLLWRGTPHRLLEAISTQPTIRLCSSTALLDELADVLSRPFASRQLSMIGKNAAALLADYIDAIDLVEPTHVPSVIAGDPDDDHVIAAAITSRARLIVSGDRRHLLPLRQHDGIDIVDASEALRRISELP